MVSIWVKKEDKVEYALQVTTIQVCSAFSQISLSLVTAGFKNQDGDGYASYISW